MIRIILSRGDGVGDRVWLQSIVRHVQTGLLQAGHAVAIDGKFGSDTEVVVRTFQEKANLGITGIVDRPTWEALSPYLQSTLGGREQLIATLLPAFQGDPDWVHQQEGHRGNPYWPGGQSGVTLDPGVDLGNADRQLAEQLFASRLTPEQWKAVGTVIGLKGESARQALQQDPILSSIRITQDQANDIMPYAARPYWKGISDRFASLTASATPAAVQTVLLSLAYNRGFKNEALDVLHDPLSSGNWAGVAKAIGEMQQDHPLEGIRLRRRLEAALVEAELAYLNA